ncbi:hypothetical protein I6A84_14520 [Frankia sp. CNm7]|uniref:AttH domain-containing protein n=2 Tax=Frankia nepalensis TaxID=1836974 RepID=A0A937UQW8_9ACTN|nr:hypothetical protein [Frankia nepalensis]MBL7509308.1 hypothetical protein [Frankia nepalensis]MBL7519285.1 hypothetical protein [Frankia nepalensis]MBL7632264.1 hypothetical protein [Frankia nepalensis]
MSRPLDASDEAFHPAGDDPCWNESAWFGFSVPERRMNGFVYFFHDVRTGVSGGGPAVWDPSGEETYTCRFYDWRWLQPPTGRLDFGDFTLPNSLRHEVVEPLRRYRLSYAELGLELDLEWTALMAPHEIRYGNLSTMTGARHFDQPGRMTGSLLLDGERLEVDCYSLRDRTWGPHRPGASRSGDYLWAIASPEDHWHAITIASDEPGVDTVMNGYLVRDGELGELVRGQRRVLERRAGAPVRVLLEAEDDRGRHLRAHGDVRTALRWFGWPGRLAFWTLTDWRWDDHQGWGEDQEFFPREQARSLMEPPAASDLG